MGSLHRRGIHRAIALSFVLVAAVAACGDDSDTPTPTTAASGGGGGGNDDGGGGMQAGAPSFTSFTVSSPVQCESGNAEVTMAYETMNVVSISIKIGDGSFASTAGYGPNESSVVASIPCDGAGESSVQLKGCTEDNTCAESDVAKVEITA